MSAHGHPRRPSLFTYAVIFFALTLVAIFALIPVTEGKSLMMVCPWLIAVVACGLGYVLFSTTKSDH